MSNFDLNEIEYADRGKYFPTFLPSDMKNKYVISPYATGYKMTILI